MKKNRRCTSASTTPKSKRHSKQTHINTSHLSTLHVYSQQTRPLSSKTPKHQEVYRSRVPSLTRVAPLPVVARKRLTRGAAFLRMGLLRTQLHRANESYHNMGKALMPDSKYDKLLDELRDLETTYPDQSRYLDKGFISDQEVEREMMNDIQLYHTDTRIFTTDSILRGGIPSPTSTVGALPISLLPSAIRRQEIYFTPKEYEIWKAKHQSQLKDYQEQEEASRRTIDRVVSTLQSGSYQAQKAIDEQNDRRNIITEKIASLSKSPDGGQDIDSSSGIGSQRPSGTKAKAKARPDEHTKAHPDEHIKASTVAKARSKRNTEQGSGVTIEDNAPLAATPSSSQPTTRKPRARVPKKDSNNSESTPAQSPPPRASTSSTSRIKNTKTHKRRLMSINSLFDPKDLTPFFKSCNNAQVSIHSRLSPLYHRVVSSLSSSPSPSSSGQAQTSQSSLSTIPLSNETMVLTMLLLSNKSNPVADALRQQMASIYTLKSSTPHSSPASVIPPTTMTVEHKYDGIAVSLEYDHGKLSTALTRGDGKEGNVVTEIMDTYTTVPPSINVHRLQRDILMWHLQSSICSLGLLVDHAKDDGKDAKGVDHKASSPSSTKDDWGAVVKQLHDYVSTVYKQNGSLLFPSDHGNNGDHDSDITDTEPFDLSDTMLSFSSQFLQHIPSSYLKTVHHLFPLLLTSSSTSLSSHLPSVVKGSINIRGECIIPKQVYASCPEFQSYSTARHFISGVYNRLDDVDSTPLYVEKTDGTKVPRKGIVDFIGYALYCDDDADGVDTAQHVTDLMTSLSNVTQHVDSNDHGGGHGHGASSGDNKPEPPKIPLSLLIPHAVRLELVKRQQFTTFGVSAEIPIDTETTATSTHHPIIVSDHVNGFQPQQQQQQQQQHSPSNDDTVRTKTVKGAKQTPTTNPTLSPIDNKLTPTMTPASPHDVITCFQANRPQFPYECDGLVFKVNSTLTQENMGQTAHHPRWSIAPKYQGDIKNTILKDIVIQVGKSGRVVPVAILEAVNVEGSYINKVVLHNHAFLDTPIFSTLRIGDEVSVEKRGGAIPLISAQGSKTYLDILNERPSLTPHPSNPLFGKDLTTLSRDEANQVIDTAISSSTQPSASLSEEDSSTPASAQWLQNIGKPLHKILPQNACGEYTCPCPHQTPLSQIENTTGSTSVSFYCTAEQCPEKKLYTLEHYCSKKGIDIDAVSSQTLQKLLDLGIISPDISSIPRLVYNEYYRASLYALAGVVVIPSSVGLTHDDMHDKPLSKKLGVKLHISPFEQYTKLYSDDPNRGLKIIHPSYHQQDTSQPTILLPPIEPGFKLKKVENILSAIHQTHQHLTVEKVLLGYGFTQTHLAILDQITDDIEVIIHLTLNDILSKSDARTATAKDLSLKLQAARDDLIRLSRYVPSLAPLQQYDSSHLVSPE